MKKIMLISVAIAAVNAFAITATKEYVDNATNAVVNYANGEFLRDNYVSLTNSDDFKSAVISISPIYDADKIIGEYGDNNNFTNATIFASGSYSNVIFNVTESPGRGYPAFRDLPGSSWTYDVLSDRYDIRYFATVTGAFEAVSYVFLKYDIYENEFSVMKADSGSLYDFSCAIIFDPNLSKWILSCFSGRNVSIDDLIYKIKINDFVSLNLGSIPIGSFKDVNVIQGDDFTGLKLTNMFERAGIITNITVKTGKLATLNDLSGVVPGNYETVSNRAMGAVQSEVDPTVPSWAKAANPPAESDPTVPSWAKATNPPSETDPTVPSWAKAETKPTYTASEVVGAATTGYVDQQNEATRAIVATWENFLDGSNVVFSITNYISGTYNLDAAKLRIVEMTNGVYREVYNSRGEIVMHLDAFKTNDFRVATNQVIQGVSAAIADKADKAWGKYTSAGGEAPSNTVYMTAPQTVFAGGMEYERVAVGEGSVCILTTKGAPVYTQGDEGTFKFQDDGGTNYFGFAKTDSYVIGANASGISVQNHIVTINYDVTMSGVPCIWYKQAIESDVEWEQLNLPNGTPVAGASHVVSWEATPPAGRETCYINCPEAKGFFKATIEVAGSAKFMTNMPADFSGGILCTDGQHKVKINWNNGAPTLVPAN